MTEAPNNAKPTEAAAASEQFAAIPMCLFCGYRLRGLPSGSPCSECGRATNVEAERQQVRDLADRGLLRLGLRMLCVWKPLPAGWWWLLDDPVDLRHARQRAWRWRLIGGLLAAACSALVVTVDHAHTILTYQHPPGEPQARQLLSSFSRSFGLSRSWYGRPTPGWVTTTETADQWSFCLDRWELPSILVSLLILPLMWSTCRWLWLPLCQVCAPTDDCERAAHQRVARRSSVITAALYYTAPMVLWLLCSHGVFLAGWAFPAGLTAAQVIYFSMNIMLPGVGWIAAIRSDRMRRLFDKKVFPIAGAMVAPLIGAVAAIVLATLLAIVLFDA